MIYGARLDGYFCPEMEFHHLCPGRPRCCRIVVVVRVCQRRFCTGWKTPSMPV